MTEGAVSGMSQLLPAALARLGLSHHPLSDWRDPVPSKHEFLEGFLQPPSAQSSAAGGLSPPGWGTTGLGGEGGVGGGIRPWH